jgi:hypothetical protein
MVDTSFSDMSSKDRPTDNRGIAANEVLVCGAVLQVHGALQDGVAIDFVTVTGRELFPPDSNFLSHSSKALFPLASAHGDENIGRRTTDGYFVKSSIAGQRYCLCKVTGYRYDYKYVHASELHSLF